MKSEEVTRLRRRLACHKRRMRYWSGLPSFSGFGPTGKSLQSGLMGINYDEACEDAMSIAWELERIGERVEVVDIKATFGARFSNPNAESVMLWPKSNP